MSNRRKFVHQLMGASVALPAFRTDSLSTIFRANGIVEGKTVSGAASDEDYWAQIQRAFDDDRTTVNLNNGGVSPTPTHVLESMFRDLKWSNQMPVWTMWQDLEPRIELVRRDLAKMFGCDPEEMAITRNASESNETMILGLDLKKGDEVVVSNQNYGRMLTAWDQRVRHVAEPCQQDLVEGLIRHEVVRKHAILGSKPVRGPLRLALTSIIEALQVCLLLRKGWQRA